MTEPVVIDIGNEIKRPRKPHTYSMDFGMAFVTEDNTQVAAFCSCRDYMQDQVRTFLNHKTRVGDDGHPYYPGAGDPDIFMPRLRLLIRLAKHSQKDLVRGLRVLNIIEEYGGMERTIAEKVKMEGEVPGTYLLRGSGEYMRNPHLLSLVTLTLRFCVYNPEFEIKDHLSLKKGYEKLNGAAQIVKDKHLMCDCYNMMHHVMKHRSTIFDVKDYVELFPTSIGYSFHSKGGIQQLCRANTAAASVNKRITGLKKKFKVKN